MPIEKYFTKDITNTAGSSAASSGDINTEDMDPVVKNTPSDAAQLVEIIARYDAEIDKSTAVLNDVPSVGTKLPSKRDRSEQSSVSSSITSPVTKKYIIGSETDDMLKLPEDAPFWVEILFKSIDRISSRIEDICSTCDNLKSEVDAKLAKITAETDKKIVDITTQLKTEFE